jgi:hypothetical protein
LVYFLNVFPFFFYMVISPCILLINSLIDYLEGNRESYLLYARNKEERTNRFISRSLTVLCFFLFSGDIFHLILSEIRRVFLGFADLNG